MCSRVSETGNRLLLLAGILALIGSSNAATINITTYGANGGDTADDRTAIQNAINAAASGDTVYFPNGTYYISGQLTPKSNIKLAGQSQSGAIIRFSATTGQAFINMNVLTNVEISLLTLDGNNNGNAHIGVYAYRGRQHNIHHLTIRNLIADNIYGPFGIHFNGSAGLGVTDSTIADNTITNIGAASDWGGGIRCSWGSSRNKILRNNITWTGRGGIFGNDGSTDLVIQSNTVAHSGKTAEGLGIEVWGGCARAIIEDNNIDHWLSLDSSSTSAVRRNTVRDLAETIISFIGLESVGSTDVVFTDNTVDHGQLIGISMSNDPAKNYGLWAYNTVQFMAMWGAQIQGDANGARYQYFYKNKFLNTVKNHPAAPYPGGHGFRFNGNTFYLTLDANEIKNNQDLGIQFSGGIDQISVVNNIITGNTGAAATSYGGVDLEWANNTVSGNGNNTQPGSRGFGNQKPTANFNAPTSAGVGQNVSFTSTSSDPDGSIGHYLWDFGEGLPSTSANPTYAYTKAGTFRVTLVVWDNLGRGARIEKNITIGTAPAAPSGLSATAVSSSQINLSWTDNANNETQFKIERKTGAGGTWSQIATVGANVTSYPNTGLSPSTTYYYRVRANNASGDSAYSNEANATTSASGGAGTGLTGKYYDNQDFTSLKTTRTDATVNFDFAGCIPSGTALTSGTTWSAVWIGQVEPQFSQTYTFYTVTDDGVRLWVNGQQLINKWIDQPATEWSGTIGLTAGQRYNVIMEYYQGGGGSAARLLWSSSSTPKAAIPQSRLFPNLSRLLELQLNEGSGTPADSSGRGNTIQNSGATWTTAGHNGAAMDFGPGGLNVTGPIQSGLNGSFSLEAWIRLRSLPAWRNGIFGKEVYQQNGFRFGIGGDAKPVFWTTESGGTIDAVSSTAITLNVWHHVKAVYSSGTLRLYLNGNLVATASGTHNASTATFQIGRFGGSPIFDGWIDEVLVTEP